MSKSDMSFPDHAYELACSVEEFHRRFLPSGYTIPKEAKDLSSELTLPEDISMFIHDRLLERMNFTTEELGEAAKALNRGEIENHVEEIADLAFFALGTLHLMGEAGAEAICRVIGKNDAKTLDTHEIDAITAKIVKRKAESAP